MLVLICSFATSVAQKPPISLPVPGRPKANQLVEFTFEAPGGRTAGVASIAPNVSVTFSGPNQTPGSYPTAAFWDGEQYRVRFAPPASGHWVAGVSFRMGGREIPALMRPFEVFAGPKASFVRVSRSNPRYLGLGPSLSVPPKSSAAHAKVTAGPTPPLGSGTFFPIGLNFCWPDDRGIESYRVRFAKLHSVGGNFARIWTTQERQHQTPKSGLDAYDAENGRFYDQVFQLADQNGIKLMLTIDDYRVLAKKDFFVAHWDKSPYNAANGGPLKEPGEFFTNPVAKGMYKRKLAYLVARYSAYPSLAAWELWNEQDNVSEPGVPVAWLREMTEYLQSIDPYHHLITTSFSWRDTDEVWQNPHIGLTQRHMYGQGDTVDFVREIEANAEKMAKYGKPTLVGEFGITWKEPDLALDKAKKGTALHNALWASLMTGHAGGALAWWWDNYFEPANLWRVFSGISAFVAGEDLAAYRFEPLNINIEKMDCLGLVDRTSGKSLIWIHDPESNWKNDANGVAPKPIRGLVMPLRIERRSRVEVWNTRTGKVLHSQVVDSRKSLFVLPVPTFERDVAIKVNPLAK